MKRGPFLVDTGFVVALVNDRDPQHAECAEVWRNVQGPFVSTEGVLVEVAWLVRKVPGAFPTAVGAVRSVGCVLMPATPWRLERALELMQIYADVPMDLVDALLVGIAEETGVRDVLTLDRRGFETFRAQRHAFRLLPD